MEKLKALFDLFRKGSKVANPAAWKEGQVTATVLAAVILAIVHLMSAFGFAVPIDLNTANAIATGIIAVVNVVLTFTTTDKIGLPPAKPVEPEDVFEKEFPKLDITEGIEVKHQEAYDKFKELSPN